MNHRSFAARLCDLRQRIAVVTVTLALLMSLTASQCRATPNDGFITDVKAAADQAAEEGKDIMLLSLIHI